MVRKNTQEYMMIPLDRGIEFYLSTLETEGKSPAYIEWLERRLGYFLDYMEAAHGRTVPVQELSVEDGRDFLRSLMKWKKKYRNYPMHKPQASGLKVQYIHRCGRAVRSFSTWAHREGYLEENIMRKLKLTKFPQTQPKPLGEEELQMHYSAAEKREIIHMVEHSDLSVWKTLEELGVRRSSFYRWYRRYQLDGPQGLETKKPTTTMNV